MKPRSLSPVASVKSTSKVIRSRVAPIASAIIAADSAKTSLSRRTFSARPGVSGGCENPMAVCVSADSYVEQSTDSVIVIVSTTSQAPLSTIPTMLVIPGWAPLPKIVEPPCSQAFWIRARSSSVCLPPVIHAALEHTLIPASSRRTSSSTLGQSGL